MSLDSSLKITGGTAKVRSVLTRPERIAKMVSDKKLDVNKNGALGLPKTRVPKK